MFAPFQPLHTTRRNKKKTAIKPPNSSLSNSPSRQLNQPQILCKPCVHPLSLISPLCKPKLNPCKRFVLSRHFFISSVTLCLSISLHVSDLNPIYTLRFVPHTFGHKSKGFRYGGNVFLLICAYAQLPFGRYERDNGFILLWDNAGTIRPFADASRQTKLRRKCRRSSCWYLRGD